MINKFSKREHPRKLGYNLKMEIHILGRQLKMYIMAMESINLNRVLIMKAGGKMEKLRERELVLINLVINMLEISKRTKDMEKVFKPIKTDKNMKDSLKKILNRVLENIYIRMVIIMRVIGNKINVRAKVDKFMSMERYIRESGVRMKKMVRES